MRIEGIRTLVSDSLHGGVLKVLSLLARLAFFVLVIPELLSGELGAYVYISSTALIAAMILIAGLDEALPRLVAGSSRTARRLRRAYLVFTSLNVVLLVALVYRPSVSLAVVCMSAVTATGHFLAGIIRGLDPAFYERLANLPWMIFIVVAIAFDIQVAIPLITVMAGAMMLTQWYCLYAIRIRPTPGDTVAPGEQTAIILQGLKEGFPRLLSNLAFFGTIRSPLLWPVWLSLTAAVDEVALAIAVGEIVAQFGLIPVNRAYTRWCKSPPESIKHWIDATSHSVAIAAALAIGSLGALYLFDALDLLPPQVENVSVVATAIVFYSIVPAFWLIRYLIWSRNMFNGWIVAISVAQFGLSAIVVVLMPYETTFLWLCLLLVLTLAVMSWKSRQIFAAAPSGA